MPNWCENDLYVEGTKKQLVGFVSKYITTDTDNRLNFDFEKVIPMPKEEEDNWYGWRCENWSTKWNAHNTYVDIDFLNDFEDNDNLTLHIAFDTAWNEPHCVIEELIIQNPDLVIYLTYFEGGCFFGGTIDKDGNHSVADNELQKWSIENGYACEEDYEDEEE